MTLLWLGLSVVSRSSGWCFGSLLDCLFQIIQVKSCMQVACHMATSILIAVPVPEARSTMEQLASPGPALPPNHSLLSTGPWVSPATKPLTFIDKSLGQPGPQTPHFI